MSVDEQVAALRAQIQHLEKVGRLEAELLDAKQAGDADRLAKVKPKLREARREQREARARDVAVSPDVLAASATVNETEG